MRTTHAVKAVAYGSPELKEVYRRYWTLGLLVSVAAHLCCVMVLQLIQQPMGVKDFRRGGTVTTSLRDILLNPPIAEPAPPRGGAQARQVENKVELATPVPVSDELADPKRTTASQEEIRTYYDNQVREAGNVEGSGDWVGGSDARETITEPDPETVYPNLERVPVLVTKVLPGYPVTAIRAELEGSVWVRVLVDKQGRVKKAVVVTSTHEMFNEPALEAARQFVFTPGYMTSGPVEVWVAVPFWFKLR